MEDKSRAVKEQQLRASINAKLIETGERERFVNLIFSYQNRIYFILRFFG
jgi:hypothetical protein